LRGQITHDGALGACRADPPPPPPAARVASPPLAAAYFAAGQSHALGWLLADAAGAGPVLFLEVRLCMCALSTPAPARASSVLASLNCDFARGAFDTP
jgi:hypothetical protein